jgi:hypothetical protein
MEGVMKQSWFNDENLLIIVNLVTCIVFLLLLFVSGN